MTVAPIEAWLATHTGLVADKLGPGQVARIARERLRETGCADAPAYVAFLSASPAEQLRFIEAIVVTETWFFRDRAALEGLVRQVTGRWATRHATGVCRVLSVPCSTGEEPYSIAMALALATWPASRLQVDAIDISRESLARGAEGVYRKNSFRGADLAFRELFFDLVEAGTWRVRDAGRAPVRFQEANLLAPEFAAGRPLYDAIFCRNLLIYFDPPVQTKAFATLKRLLADDGLLAVGPAEAVLALEHGFSPVPGESMFLFQKAAAKSAPAPGRTEPARTRANVHATPVMRPVAATKSREVKPAAEPALVLSPIEQMRALADAGRLREAAQAGEALLRDAGATVEVCYLLAVVADAAGDGRRAEEFYRKTLYLNPQHAESLVHLALLLEKKGDVVGAAALRARTMRMKEGSQRRNDAKEVA